ncbi:1-phosphofructokinase family hexose kinase [Paludibaculum fermentans]|uniref:1-phosphofructokinase family hexose kinase n=1 Tax=Paludibaculum fermentans TaxID=1473598 RepID=A0A7S7SIF4_PALFE|nr:1-phosphofructokinase family hexose kinase [Paludibaculum fermentans]QOY86019.1 1-phosphofructokinase family hexose kinase [Paludibaculum fermentans]
MILTLTANPAIDRNVAVDRLVFEDRAYILSTRESAGGRGINASSVIHSYGGPTLAIAICGGKSGKLLEGFLSQAEFPCEFVRVRHEIRTNFTIADKNGLAIKLNEHGPALSQPELSRLEKTVRHRMKEATWLLLCGSVPPGVPAEFYARLIQAASKLGVKTLLDTDGEAVEAALEQGPTVVTPNQPEAERLLNRALLTRNHFQEAAERIRGMGAKNVILSLGARGALGAFEDGSIWEAVPPRIDALCPIGAGDALAAAYAWAAHDGKEAMDALRWGVAAGTASARLPGVSFANLQQTREIYGRVEVRRLN